MVITFLGIVLNSGAMECRLPLDKLEALKVEIMGMLGLRKVQLGVLQSLLGKLNFVCRILPMGGCFAGDCRLAWWGSGPPSIFCVWSKHTGRICKCGIPSWSPLTEGHCGCPTPSVISIWSLRTQAESQVLRSSFKAVGVQVRGRSRELTQDLQKTWCYWNCFQWC